MKKAKQELVKMLTESTDKALCDSGGDNGRHWQKNKADYEKDVLCFEKQKAVSCEIYANNDKLVTTEDIIYNISVYHFLKDRLELDELCIAFNNINTKANNWNCDLFYGVSKEGEGFLAEYGFEAIGDSFNTYNGECFLSQTLQGHFLDMNGIKYVLLQIHNGCDVRGGYTDARLFRIDKEEYFLQDVYGTVTKVNGDIIQIDNTYNGYDLTDENGNYIELLKDDKVELSI